MYKKHKLLLVPALLLCSTTAYSAAFPGEQQPVSPGSTDGETPAVEAPVAFDDHITVVPNNIKTVEDGVVIVSTSKAEGNVVTNDKNGSFVRLVSSSSPVGEYGLLDLKADGSFTYTLFENSPNLDVLSVGDVKTDVFTYIYTGESGDTAEASLNVQIIGNPVDVNGDTIFQQPIDELYDNVDVEFNDRSAQATPLNSGRNIKGHLHHSNDKDWYRLASDGNEIVTLEVCPKGSTCFGKKSWVLYVFDSKKLTPAMEAKNYTFQRWIDETGSNQDEKGDAVISGTHGSSNHMYLNYKANAFDGALIGIIDPCFGNSNTVDIGVLDKGNYFIAISSPLKGSGDGESCGSGSVVLQEPGLNVIGQAPDGEDDEGNPKYKNKKYATTQEFVTVFPKSDDQYSIKITGTGDHPLLSDDAKSKSSTYKYDVGELMIPKVRVFDKLFSANLTLETSVARNANKNGKLSFGLTNLSPLNVEVSGDAYQATYNPDTQRVIIPRVTDVINEDAYSVTMQYHPATESKGEWLEVIHHELIK